MKKYTIGAVFTHDLKQVLLIRKNKPEWQKGKLNFPGGHIEEGELGVECVSMEFEEETGLKIPVADWKYIGKIDGEDYYVEFYSSVYSEAHGSFSSKTAEDITMVDSNDLPENVISNLRWLVPFAKNIISQGNYDRLLFGTFKYGF